MEYQGAIGTAKAVLSWSCKEQMKQVIPQEQLYCLPKAPEGITAVPSIRSVVLKWNEAAGAESYDIGINNETISGVNATEYVIENLTPDTGYTIKVRSVSSFGAGEWSKAITVATLEEQDAVQGNGNGLKGEYYDNIIFKKLLLERVDQKIDFDWGKGTPDPKIKKNTFSVKWTGKLLPQYTAKHTIYLYSDDGAKLWINGKELIDYWKPHSSKEGSAAIDLVAGEKCDIKIEYFNIMGDAEVKLYWSNPYEEKTIIPMEQLFTTPGITENLQAAAEGSRITVTWDNTPGAEAYELEVDGTTVNIGMEARYVHDSLIPNSQHTYRVRAVNEVGKGGWSELVTRTSAPGIPSNIAMEETDRTITVTWDAVEAAEAYEIERDGETAGNGSSTSYTHSSLIPNTKHKYRIRSVNSNGKGEWSGVYSKYTLPDTPENFTTAVTSNTITISWDAVPGVLSYEIEADGEVRNTGLETSYTHGGLRPNTEHTYRIRTIGYAGAGYWSTEIKASTMLAVPRNITAEATSSTITVTWDSVEYAQYYDLESDGIIIDNGGSTEFTHSALSANTGHTYRVRAREDLGAGDWSEPVIIKTLLETPSNLNAEATDSSITIKWDAVAGADSYEVELSGVRTIKVSGPECVIDGLDSNTSYSYRVMASCEGNESEWSSEHSIITLLEAPSNIIFESSSTITEVKWDMVDDADRYEIEVDGIVLDNGTNTSYTHNGLEPDSRHEYKIRAINSNGTGVWSGLLLKTTAPHIPVNLFAVSTSRTNTLSWDMVEEAGSYEVEADSKIVINTADTAFVHRDIDPDSEHSYRVRAVNSNGKGDWSLPLSKTTAPHVPAGITAISGSTEIKFVWEEVYETEEYEIDIDDVLLTDITETVYLYSELAPNSEHKFRIRAVNDNGIGDWSEPVYKYTAPDVPGNISTASTSTGITLTWDEVEAAEGYQVEVLGSPVDNGNSTIYTNVDLNPNTQRTYRVRAKNGNGLGDWSAIVAETTLTDAPVNLSISSTETSIRLRWGAVAGATAYDVEADSILFEDILVNEYNMSGLSSNSQHTFRVRSKNGNAIGGWSSEITGSTLTAVPVVTLTEASYNSIKTVWESVYGASGYEIEIDGLIIDCGTDNEYIHQNLLPNTKHTYRVRSKNEYGIGNWSELIEKLTLPDIPVNLAVETTSSSAKLTWDKVGGAIGYEVEANGAVLSAGIENSFIHEKLTPYTEYVYRVRARSEAGAGNWSGEVRVFTLIGVPQNIKTFSSGNSTKLVWDEVYGITEHEIEADGSLVEIGPEAEYIHSELMPNTTHIYRIRARKADNAGDWSEPIFADTLLASIADIKAVSTNTTISLNWTTIGDAESYDVEANGNITAGILEPKYKLEGLLPNTPHTFKIMARSETNTSDWSTLITKYTTPDIPANIIVDASTTTVAISWDAVDGAVGYDIEAGGIIIDNEIKTSYTHEGLSPNTQHIYRLRARNEYEVSEWSTEIIGTTEPELVFNCAEDSLFNFVIAAPKVEDAIERTITVTYNPEELEVVDLCAATANRDIETGEIPGTNLEVKEYAPGTIVFSLIDPSKSIMNAVKFKAKINGQSKILYVIE